LGSYPDSFSHTPQLAANWDLVILCAVEDLLLFRHQQLVPVTPAISLVNPVGVVNTNSFFPAWTIIRLTVLTSLGVQWVHLKYFPAKVPSISNYAWVSYSIYGRQLVPLRGLLFV